MIKITNKFLNINYTKKFRIVTLIQIAQLWVLNTISRITVTNYKIKNLKQSFIDPYRLVGKMLT